jgi:hypothetical protein
MTAVGSDLRLDWQSMWRFLMSVLAEAISVIVPVSVLEAKYPGGFTAYVRDCPNGTFCADEHLTRVGFMVPADVDHFTQRLVHTGFTYLRDGYAEDFVVVDQHHGLTTPCEWLEGGKFPEGYSAVWLAGTTGRFRYPNGWTPAQSKGLKFFAADHKERILELDSTGSTVLDLDTGRERYIGRAFPDSSRNE